MEHVIINHCTMYLIFTLKKCFVESNSTNDHLPHHSLTPLKRKEILKCYKDQMQRSV